jgi:hypothetical protein
LLVVVVGVGLWGFQQGQQWLLRWRAERLLAEIQAVNVSQSDGGQAEAIGARWKKWDSPSQKCTRDDCQHRIVMEVHIPGHFGFDYEHPDRLQPFVRVLDRLGLRPSAVIADIRVRHGVITSKDFGVDIARPVRFWGSPEGGLDTEIKADDREGANLRVIPDYYFGNIYSHVKTEPHGTLIAESTPQEPLQHRRELMDFRLECITRWSPCLTNAELLPEAGAEAEAAEKMREDLRRAGKDRATERRDCNGRDLEFMARQNEEVWIVTAEVRREPELTEGGSLEYIPYVRPQQILKGKNWPPPGVLIETAGFDDEFSASVFGKSDRLFVFGQKDTYRGSPFFRADTCSFTRITPENLMDVNRGIAEDFDRADGDS